MSEDAFYLALGDDAYRATEHTVGPWSPDSQHLGPPSALLARQLERTVPEPGWVLARMTVEILGAVPVADVTMRSWVERPGRSVRLTAAELSAGGRPAARAWAWWLAATDTTAVLGGLPDPLRPLASGTVPAPPEGWQGGYLHAMEWVSIKGMFGQDGPATLWIRQRMPTVAGEEPTGLQRVMAVADSGNGASSQLDLREWLFVNTELTVHLWRVPDGEWIGLDAGSVIGPAGVGLATSILHDATGPVGRGAQALLVRPR